MMNWNFALFALNFGLLCATFYLVALLWRRLNTFQTKIEQFSQQIKATQK